MIPAVPGRGVSKQEDRRTTVFSAAEHPHEGLRLRPSVRFFQYLHPGLICHGKAPFQEFTMEVIIHRPEILLRTVDDPVGQGRPRDHGAVLGPVFFLAVLWYMVHATAEEEAGPFPTRASGTRDFTMTGFPVSFVPCLHSGHP